LKSFVRSERHDADRKTEERMIKKGRLSLEEIADCVPLVNETGNPDFYKLG